MSLLRNIIPRNPSLTYRGAMCTLSLPTSPRKILQRLTIYHPYQQHEHYSFSASREMRTSTSLSSQRVPASRETLLITDKAIKRLKDILEKDSFLRVIVESGGCSGFQYKFELDKKIEEEDIEILHSVDNNSQTVLVIDPTSLDILRGSTVDYEIELIRSAFRIINIPQAENGCSCGASFTVKID